MPQRRVLFFCNSRLTAYRVGGGGVWQEASFASDEAGLQAFGDYLAAHPRSLFLILADVTEESYQTEDVPYSRGKDRAAIVRRKLAQHYYGTPYALAQSQGRLKSGRRDERLLFMALTHPRHFDPWLGVLRRQQAILAGIYALPQTMGELLSAKTQGKDQGQLLLLTLTHAGLRQTFFADGHMRFSRLTPLIHDSADASALAASSEAVKMHQYLASQRLIDRDRPLTTRILVHPAEAAAMRARCTGNHGLRFEFADLLDTARRAGLRTRLEHSRADELFCHLLVRKTPDVQFAQPDELAFHRLWRIRFGLRSTAAIVVAGGALFAAHHGLDLLQLREDIDQVRQQTLHNQSQYTRKLEALPKIPLSTDDLRALTERYGQLAKRAGGPAPLLIQISRSLDAYPPIQVDHIEWSLVEQLAPMSQAAAGPASASNVVAVPIPPRLTVGPYAQATVTARLPAAMVGDHRGQLALVADFAKHLGNVPDTLVSILQPPVDTQSGKTLKSGDEKSVPEAPKFVFRVTRKL